MGLVCPSHILPLTEPSALREGLASLFRPRATFRIRPQLRISLYHWLWQFAKRCRHRQMIRVGRDLQRILDFSLSEFRSLLDTHTSLRDDLTTNGLLYVLKTDLGMRSFAKTDAILSGEFGLSARRLDSDELAAFEPSLRGPLAGAFHYPDDFSIRPDTLCSNWSGQLKKSGVRVLEHVELTEIMRSSGRIEKVLTLDEPLEADHYVFAVGAWSRAIGTLIGHNLPVEPGKGYSVTVDGTNHSLRHPLLLPEQHVGITPFRDRIRIGSIMEFAGYDTSIPETRIAQLQNTAREFLAAPTDSVVDDPWYGWRPMTWDSLPIIGRVPGLDNATLATGHNMLGLALAPATGRLVSQIVMETKPDIAMDAFSPDRF